MKPNFEGYATKYGVLCSDGRTIVADAFKHQDNVRLPLVWRHGLDKSPENVLGHAILTHEDGVGVRAAAYLNKSKSGEAARHSVENGDLDMLSIRAINLQQNGTFVTHGDLDEVSIVPRGANREARIDSVYLQHADGYTHEVEDAGVIYTGIPFELTHEDESAEVEQEESEASTEEQTVSDIYNSMTDEQKDVVAVLVNAARNGELEQEDSDESEEINHEGNNMPKTRNVFDRTDSSTDGGAVLTHENIRSIFEEAKRTGSLREAVLQHADQYGITNIQDLFPEPKKVTDRPEWIKRDDSWVAGVLSSVRSTPFSRIKSMSASLTHEEARAKGYIKGNMKKEQFFSVAGRVTTPTTVYKKQKLDRDDIVDVTDFDVVVWIKEEMRWMLQEELARAILFGDNRPVEDPANAGEPNPDKIDEERIRPIATDEDFYTAKVSIPTGATARTLARTILRSRKLLKGSTGRPTLYTVDDLIVDLLLWEDKLGRRYYETESALAAALGVANIVPVEVLEETYEDEDGNRLIGVLVNLTDYTVGADKGGQTAMFDDFDIDFNQYKYLIETRRSGALTRHRSAVSLWESGGDEVAPTAPTSDGTDVTIPSVPGVEYWTYTGTNDPVKSTGSVTIPEGETLYVEARPASGYRFPFNVTTEWDFARA